MMLRPASVKESLMREADERTSPPSLAAPSFPDLVERHERELLRFLGGIVSDAEQARDLLQDTFYDAWRAAQRGAAPFVPASAPEEVRRWLFHAAYCRAMSALRRRRLIRWVSLDRAETPGLDGIEAVVSFEDQVAENEALGKALADLAPEDVACLLLIVVQGFTAAEAGQVIGASPQAVAKRIARAKRRLLNAYLAGNARQEGGSGR
jgi:RNA polymerase sigma-70 factor (ECF subfamily)